MRGWGIRLGILIAVILAVAWLSAPGYRMELPPYDREAAWKTLWRSEDPEAAPPPTEKDFDASLAGLDKVVLDPPPVVGENYNPTFPDELPFKPQEWKTTTPSASIANPDAPKGGLLRLAIDEWPPTIRTEGPNSRLATTSDIHGLIYETLVGYDQNIGDFVPGLASHWQIGKDKRTFRFRINPKARWSNGAPVTADDVVASFEHVMNPDRKDPATANHFQEVIEGVRMLDRLTVEFVAKEARWRSFLTIGSGQQIYPAAYIRMDGETYLTEWNWKLPPGTGPYELRIEDIRKGRSITVRRRKDYWDEDNPLFRGSYNFNSVRWEVVLDDVLKFQKFLKGDLDAFLVSRAQQWVAELDDEKPFAMGWAQRRKVYNQEPQGYAGYCFNIRRKPFDSRNVREAFAHLLNREKLFEKFFFYQYEYIDSYFPGQPWARSGHRRVPFDPETGRHLLAKDGWTKRDGEGFLVNEQGERFPALTLEYNSHGWTRIHSVYKDELWQQAGIKLEFKVIDGSTILKNVWDGKYDLVFWGWTASLFPDPEFQFHSKYAEQPQTNNINGFKNAEADALMDEYKFEFDAAKRLTMLQRLDEILFDEHLYALGWYGPYFRVLYWDKFGHPPEYASRFGRHLNNIIAYWWYDEAMASRLKENQATGRPSYPDKPRNQYDELDQTWWKSHDEPMPRNPKRGGR